MMNQKIAIELERKILLNPGPATTSERVKSALVISDICPREEEFGELLLEVKRKLKAIAHGENYHCVMLGGSGTASVESCLSSCTSENGKVLILVNGAYGKRMKQICDRLGIQADTLEFSEKEAIDPKIVEDHLKDRKGHYEVLAFIHHETTTGVLNSLEDLSQIGKEYGASVLVDAMSSFAGVPINLDGSSVDYLVSSSNKCLHGMAGLGIILLSPSEYQRIQKNPKKSFYLDLCSNLDSQEKNGQFSFTPPVQVLYALNEAIDELIEEGGVKARNERYQALYKTMIKGMKELGFKVFTKESDNSEILTTFLEPELPGHSFEKMHMTFYQRGITIYPGKVAGEGTFRISNIGDLNTDDIFQFLSVMGDYLNSLQR